MISYFSCWLMLPSSAARHGSYPIEMHGFWSLSKQPKEVLKLTGGVRLPADAHDVWIYKPDEFLTHLGLESKYRLMFQADIAGIKKFVKDVTGKSLEEFTADSDRYSFAKRGFPTTEPWAADKIENGRYFERWSGRGGVAVDLDHGIVYLCPM